MKNFKADVLASATVGLFGLALAQPAVSQTDWPNRPVSVIVPFAAGGGADPLARLIFDDMAQRLGQPFPLEFRPGGSGTIGASAVAKSDPDGYTILFTSSAPAVHANFRKNITYDPLTDIVPIIQVTYAPSFVVANAEAPYSTFQELIDHAKANPGGVNAAVSGIGGVDHHAVAVIQHKTGAQFNIVPYSGAGAMMADLLSGVVNISFGLAAPFKPGVESGKLKFIALLSDQRHSNLPDVPIADESDYKGIYRGNWFMAFVPKGTPPEIVSKINAEIGKTIAVPAVREKIVQQLWYTIVTGTPEDAAALVKKDVAEMEEVIESGLFKIE